MQQSDTPPPVTARALDQMPRRTLLGGMIAAIPSLSSAWARRPPARAAQDQTQADLGTLTPFYRSMQMQSQIQGQDLISIPAYLRAPDAEFRYRPKPGMQQEIPFVDSFSIARFLGGLNEARVAAAGLMDQRLGQASLDYVLNPGGPLQHRPDIMRSHLGPYLAAGYNLSDITIVTDNVPWGIARDHGELGTWGQKNPPATMDLWRETISDLAADLHQAYGAAAAPNFKVGIEYDTKASFNGDAQDYLNLYTNAYRILRRAFPHAEIASAEFTRNGECAGQGNCVYDEAEFLQQASAAGAAPDYVARSLNAFQNRGNPMPGRTVQRAEDSFARLGSVVPEIHQFGLLGQPFGEFGKYGSDTGSHRATWEFATLMGFQVRLKPRRVFHWSTFYAPRGSGVALINGIGFVRLILDRYVGAEMTRLATSSDGADNETTAVHFALPNVQAIVVANYTAAAGAASNANVTVQLPQAMTRDWRFTRYGFDNNAFNAIRNDLEAAGNLNPAFVAAPGSTSDPDRMSNDPRAAQAMVVANIARYIAMTADSMRLKPLSKLPYQLAQSADTLSISMPPNELLVLQAAAA